MGDTRCVVLVEFRIVAGRIGEFAELVEEQARRSLADEPECLTFDVCYDPEDPEAAILYEIYRSRADFDAHLATPHFRSFDDASAPMVRSKSVRILETRAR